MTQPEASIDYAGFVGSVDLLDVKLAECSFKMKPEITNPDQKGWKYGYSCEATDIHYEQENGLLWAWVQCSAHAKSGRAQILQVKGKYLLVYRVNGQTSEDVATNFTRNVGAISVYPYFRSLFADLCAQGGARVPPLPVMKGPRRSLAQWADAEVKPG